MTAVNLRSGAEAPVFLIHGSFAVPDAEDGYTMVSVQQGVVTGLGQQTVTVTSPDGYSKTYRWPDPEVAELGTGSLVTVIETDDGTAHLARLADPPEDGSRIAAFVPVVPLHGHAGQAA